MLETKTITVTGAGQQTRISVDPAKKNMMVCDAGASDIFTIQGAVEAGGTLMSIPESVDWTGPMLEMLYGNFAEISITVSTLVSAGFTFKLISSPKH